MCVFWIITRISQLYCSTVPLRSAPQTLHLSSLHSVFLSFAFVFLSSQINTLSVFVYLCCGCVCLLFATVFFQCVCVQSVCLSLAVWVALWMCLGVCVCVCVHTRAIRERYMVYPVEGFNILMHTWQLIYKNATHRHTLSAPKFFDLGCLNLCRKTFSNWV